MKKKILFISLNQYGYQINMYHYIKYLKEYYDFTYLCVDYGNEKLRQEGVEVIYTDPVSSGYGQILAFLKSVRSLLTERSFDLVFIKYFPLSSLINLFTGVKTILQLDSGAVSSGKIHNLAFNIGMKFETLFFKELITLSQSIQDYLNLPGRKTSIVPLGSERLGNENYDYNALNLIYIGNFNWRRLSDTIDGFKLFCDEFGAELDLSYTVIGYGNQNEVDLLKSQINEYDLGEVIHFEGTVPYDKLPNFIQRSNVGVSYIPITREFDIQPPTKTIEYLLAGLPTIATATSENQKLIHEGNGVLIDDTADGFYQGLCEIKDAKYDNELIRGSMTDYTWENRVLNYLKPIFERLLTTD